MTHLCPIPNCRKRVSERYFMCSPHWRLVPLDVRKAWSITVRQYNARPTRVAAAATWENRREVVRIVCAIASGVAA